jgi:hypothetical protein
LGGTLDELRQTVDRLATDAERESARRLSSATRWDRVYLMLGLPAAMLAAIAGATGLASAAGRIPAAVITLVSAALSAAVIFLDSQKRAATNRALSGGWDGLAGDARLFRIRRLGGDYIVEGVSPEARRRLRDQDELIDNEMRDLLHRQARLRAGHIPAEPSLAAASD